MEEKKLNEKESLDLIAQMILNTKRNLESGAGNRFIIWGVSTLIATLTVYVGLTLTGNPLFSWAWFLIPVIGAVWTRLTAKRSDVYTEMDRIVRDLWRTIGAIAVLLPIVVLVITTYFADTLHSVIGTGALQSFVPFMEMFVVSLGFAITGAILKFKPVAIGGRVGMLLAFGLLLNTPVSGFAIFALWAVVSMIIPGIKLNLYIRKTLKNV